MISRRYPQIAEDKRTTQQESKNKVNKKKNKIAHVTQKRAGNHVDVSMVGQGTRKRPGLDKQRVANLVLSLSACSASLFKEIFLRMLFITS